MQNRTTISYRSFGGRVKTREILDALKLWLENARPPTNSRTDRHFRSLTISSPSYNSGEVPAAGDCGAPHGLGCLPLSRGGRALAPGMVMCANIERSTITALFFQCRGCGVSCACVATHIALVHIEETRERVCRQEQCPHDRESWSPGKDSWVQSSA
jgi:hypothetical protein